MNRAIELRNDLDDLTLYAERVGNLLKHFDLHALHDIAARLDAEIMVVRRELLLLDAGNLTRALARRNRHRPTT